MLNESIGPNTYGEYGLFLVNIYPSQSKFSRRQTDFFFLFFPKNRICHFKQIVSNGDNLHEI